jgi:hypothetical protein
MDKEYGEIMIVNAKNERKWFTREIEDVTTYKNLVVISWKHREG